MNNNAYQILEIENFSSPDEVKRAYKKLSKKYHPDLNKSHYAEEKFMEINKARDLLTDVYNKQLYDEYLLSGTKIEFESYIKNKDILQDIDSIKEDLDNKIEYISKTVPTLIQIAKENKEVAQKIASLRPGLVKIEQFDDEIETLVGMIKLSIEMKSEYFLHFESDPLGWEEAIYEIHNEMLEWDATVKKDKKDLNEALIRLKKQNDKDPILEWLSDWWWIILLGVLFLAALGA